MCIVVYQITQNLVVLNNIEFFITLRNTMGQEVEHGTARLGLLWSSVWVLSWDDSYDYGRYNS